MPRFIRNANSKENGRKRSEKRKIKMNQEKETDKNSFV